MTRLLLFVFIGCGPAIGFEPVRTAWIMSPTGGSSALRSRPEVHSILADERSIRVRSAGISSRYLGPLQQRPVPGEGLQQFEFRIPIRPEPETGRHARVPVDVIGVFLNGVPMYNQFESLSWNGANVWHYDAVARSTTRAEDAHPSPAGLLEALILDGSWHSPLIGFALDGYPVYGPWAYAQDGRGLRRMTSSYRLRRLRTRQTWPDGTRLTPAQYGPDVSPNDPLGTFAEDWEYIPGSGDLDEYNGRFAITPEFPQGTYAYFLSTDEAGSLAFPYLIGPRFYGRVQTSAGQTWHRLASKRVGLSSDAPQVRSGIEVRFRLEAKDASGDLIRAFEYVHERPIHLLIASADLAEFDHIHPELAPDDSYQVSYKFPHAGKYRMWLDYSLPGEPPRVEEFDLRVAGESRPMQRLVASASLAGDAGPLSVRLTPSKPLRAGEDIPMSVTFSGPLDTLAPYLGAWAHVIVVGEGWRSFAHAHPMEPAGVFPTVHTHAPPGPPPDEVRIVTSFPTQGLYKLWLQFLSAGQVRTVPFVLRVGPGATAPTGVASRFPTESHRIRVTQQGYEPARVAIPANTHVNLTFTREATPNCGLEVVFPVLGIRQKLPLGETVLVQLPPQPAGEISFSCGMGMYRGSIVAR